LRANFLPRPRNDNCYRRGKHFRGCRDVLKSGLVTYCDAIKTILF
jgi:hypothetical protein